MKKVNSKNLIAKFVILCALIITCVTTFSFAWLTGSKVIEFSEMQGSILAQYFHSGKGTKEDPFTITRPNHYYYLVNLYQRLDGFSNEPYYFQLGAKLKEKEDDDGLYVYNYGNDGNRITDGEQYSKTLNLAYYSGNLALLPIGTSEKPFVGTFNGNGLTVANLNIKATETYGTETFTSADIGIFGYLSNPVDDEGNLIAETDSEGNTLLDDKGNTVYKTGTVKNVYFDNVTIDFSGADVSKLCKNPFVHDSTVDFDNPPQTAHQDTVFVGVIAGHITTTNEVEDVYINRCTFKGSIPATCNFGYFGCIEDGEGVSVNALGSEVGTLRGAGNEAGFGGSMDMENIYNRLADIVKLSSNNFKYDNNKTVTVDELTGSVTYEYPNPSGQLGSSLKGYSVEGGGTYLFYDTSSGSSYNYVSGLSETETTTVTTYTYLANGGKTDYLYDDAIIIGDGTNYIGLNNTNIVNTNSQNAQPFVYTNDKYLYTRIDGELRYLSVNGTTGIQFTNSKTTIWNKSQDNELYAVIGGKNYYLCLNNGAWSISPDKIKYYLGDGTHFLLANNDNSTVSSINVQNSATKWCLSNPSDTTTIYYMVNGTTYYLGQNGNGQLSISTTSTNWSVDGNGYYIAVSTGDKLYLTYDNGWKLKLNGGYLISDGNGNYLSATTSGVTNATEQNALSWVVVNPTSATTQIYTILNGTKYYLSYYNNSLTVRTTAYTWNQTENSLSNTSDNVSVTYDNGWKVLKTSFYAITDGNGNYLVVNNGTISNTTNKNQASQFTYTTSGTNPSGKFSSGTYYIYNNNGTLATTPNNSTATVWLNDGNSLYYESGTLTYVIRYNGSWNIQTVNNGTVITDGNGNYLQVTSTTTFTNVTNIDNATRFTFSKSGSDTSETISTRYNNTTVYLRNNGGTLQVSGTSTPWSNNGNNIYNGSYYLVYNNGWKLNQGNSIESTKYKISSGSNYMAYSMNGSTPTLTNTTNANADNVILWNGNSDNISTTINGITYYLTSTTTNGATLTLSTSQNTATWTAYNTNYRYFTATSGWTTYRFWIKFNNGWVNVRTSNYKNATSLTFTEKKVTTYYYSNTQTFNETKDNSYIRQIYSNLSNVRKTLNSITNYANKTQFTEDFSLRYDNSRLQVVQKTTSTERTGTYFPIRVCSDDGVTISYTTGGKTYYLAYDGENIISTDNSKSVQILNFYYDGTGKPLKTMINGEDKYLSVNTSPVGLTLSGTAINWTKTNNKYYCTVNRTNYYLTYNNGWTAIASQSTAVQVNLSLNGEQYATSQKNTGYIVGGRNQSSSSNDSDIRISKYKISGNISNSYTKPNFTNIYTVDNNGSRVLNATEKESSVYKVASEQFLNTLNADGTNVYGLHFMNAQISMTHIIKAKQVTVLGQTFENYEFPESCIDFTAVQRGSINFFAGTYFPGNTVFFSLHEIFRDKDQKITAIKEIIKVYADPEQGVKVPYVYLYKDGTYSGNNTSVPSGYVQVFDTAWITNPSGVSSDNKQLYYFEIPCNAGEYALGSVEGETGAYLCYLDIGTNGGAVLESVLSSEGNSVTESFKVDIRSESDIKENYAILQYAVTKTPTCAKADDFSVTVSFDGTAVDDDLYPKGLYTINVVNKSNEDIELTVYLMDDNAIPNDAFPYAYKVIYTNQNETNAVIVTPSDYEVWKSVAIFNIYHDKPAEESAYK